MGSVICKVCGGGTFHCGTVDFQRSLNLEKLPVPSGPIKDPICYRRCGECGFLFTDAFDEWTIDQFRERIYNDMYPTIDPDYAERRPTINATFVSTVFGSVASRTRVLDYGGGNGLFARLLKDAGFRNVHSHDEMDGTALDDRIHDLITCFETLEHLPDPHRAMHEVTSRLAQSGVVIFTTLLQPEPPPGVEWWYLGPRSGHISLFSPRSLRPLFNDHGLRLRSLSDVVHVGCRIGEERSELVGLLGRVFGGA